MPSNSEYAHRQFRAEATERAEKELMEQELRTLRKKVEALEEKVAFLANQVSSRRMVEEYPRGFS